MRGVVADAGSGLAMLLRRAAVAGSRHTSCQPGWCCGCASEHSPLSSAPGLTAGGVLPAAQGRARATRPWARRATSASSSASHMTRASANTSRSCHCYCSSFFCMHCRRPRMGPVPWFPVLILVMWAQSQAQPVEEDVACPDDNCGRFV